MQFELSQSIFKENFHVIFKDNIKNSIMDSAMDNTKNYLIVWRMQDNNKVVTINITNRSVLLRHNKFQLLMNKPRVLS